MTFLLPGWLPELAEQDQIRRTERMLGPLDRLLALTADWMSRTGRV